MSLATFKFITADKLQIIDTTESKSIMSSFRVYWNYKGFVPIIRNKIDAIYTACWAQNSEYLKFKYSRIVKIFFFFGYKYVDPAPDPIRMQLRTNLGENEVFIRESLSTNVETALVYIWCPLKL